MSNLEISELKERDITEVKGVGPSRAKLLKKLGINTLYDLFFFYPKEYEDAGGLTSIARLVPGEKFLVSGEITGIQEQRSQRRRSLIITKAFLKDNTGELGLIWFQQRLPTPTPLYRCLEQNRRISVYGKVEVERGYVVMKNPEVEPEGRGEFLNMGRIIPIYPLTEGLTQRSLRRVIRAGLDEFLDQVVDPLPAELKEREGLLGLVEALEELHFPTSSQKAEKARHRLAFDKLLAYGLALEERRQGRTRQGIRHSRPGKLIASFLASLPFEPTGAQKRAARQIWEQMAAPTQMEHLLIGDVGSGKTLVATLAILKTIEDGHQAAFMAPTGILALQHYQSLSKYLAGLNVRTRLLLGETPAKEKEEIYTELREHRCDLVVGTHSLIQEEVAFADLGLAVTDEQHRFGVEQRKTLSSKGSTPDILVLSATPIPRTLALAAYGELGYSVLDELPPGRRPVTTKWIRSSRLPRVWQFVREEVRAGYCGYVICSLVEESPELPGVRGVVEYAQELKNGPLADLRVAVLHGGMSEEEKAQILAWFKQGEVDVLVSTTVVEIGVDVSTASFIIIMNAERFGLAQLHQLRGRVGRGSRKSYCILCSDSDGELAAQRLRTLEKVSSGQQIAEVDLRLRGPGEVFGLKQHGTDDIIFQTMLKHPQIHERAFAVAQGLGKEDWQKCYPQLARFVQAEFGELVQKGGLAG
ncbi:MAG: ATP-dependent DNA helicase RecG [Firmicutes bacterium]|nr:ATP-dependent DNA helicase RecG [Bacillota bacterium]